MARRGVLSSNGKRQMSGILSYQSTKKLVNSILLLYDATEWKESVNPKTNTKWKWKLNLITLTLPAPQRISDSELRRNYLNHFLIVLMTKFNCKGYIWRMEPQANGNAHFHIVTDVYFPHQALRWTWNKILSKGTFIQEFATKNGHSNPNSTDIHSLQRVNNVGAYLAKYMSKNHDGDNVRRIEGKLWGCSENLQGQSGIILSGDDVIKAEEQLTKAIQKGCIKYKRADYCELYFSFGNQPICEWITYESVYKYAELLNSIIPPPDT